MSGVIKIEILETEDDLKLMLKSNPRPRIKERIQALYWLKMEKVQTTLDIAQLLGKHRTTVSRWLTLYRTGGVDALTTKPPKRKVLVVIPNLVYQYKKFSRGN